MIRSAPSRNVSGWLLASAAGTALLLLGCETSAPESSQPGSPSENSAERSPAAEEGSAQSSHPVPEGHVIAGSPGKATEAASDLTTVVRCDRSKAGRAVVDLKWQSASQPGAEQRIAVTIYGDGFETGRFDLSQPLPAEQTFLEWDLLKGQAFHNWRVITWRDGTWVPSETGRFEGPTCVGATKLEDPYRKQEP